MSWDNEKIKTTMYLHEKTMQLVDKRHQFEILKDNNPVKLEVKNDIVSLIKDIEYIESILKKMEE